MAQNKKRTLIVFTLARMTENLALGLYIGIQDKYFGEFGEPKRVKRLPLVDSSAIEKLGEKFEIIPVHVEDGLEKTKGWKDPISNESVFLGIEIDPREMILATQDSPWSLVPCETAVESKYEAVRRNAVDPVLKEMLGSMLFIDATNVLRDGDKKTKEAILALFYYLSVNNRLMMLNKNEREEIRFDKFGPDEKVKVVRLLSELIFSVVGSPTPRCRAYEANKALEESDEQIRNEVKKLISGGE